MIRNANRALLLVALLAVVNPLYSAARIEKLREFPERYGNREVSIRAKVERKIPIPLTGNTVYILDDRGFRLPMLSKEHFETGDTIRSRAKVIAYTNPYDENKKEKSIDQLAETLVDAFSIGTDKAQSLAKAVISVLTTIAGAIEGTYLLVSLSDS
jgi:hypothetical protein